MNKIVKRSLLAGAVVALMASAAWSHGPWDGGPGYGGMGPGMMGGYGGGPGMMGGYGWPGMGRGEWGAGGDGALDLSPEQRTKIDEIRDEFSRQQWALMSRMHNEGLRENQALRRGEVDENAARKAYDEMAAVRKQMFEDSLQMQKRIDDVLTPEQRRKLGR